MEEGHRRAQLPRARTSDPRLDDQGLHFGRQRPRHNCTPPASNRYWNATLQATSLSSHCARTPADEMERGTVIAGPDTNCFNRRIRQISEYMDKCKRRGCDDIRPDARTYNIVMVKKCLDKPGGDGVQQGAGGNPEGPVARADGLSDLGRFAEGMEAKRQAAYEEIQREVRTNCDRSLCFIISGSFRYGALT
jgi:hypothetical protein